MDEEEFWAKVLREEHETLGKAMEDALLRMYNLKIQTDEQDAEVESVF